MQQMIIGLVILLSSPSPVFSVANNNDNKEHQLFGEGGFEKTVTKVSEIENQLGIYPSLLLK